MTTRIYLVRHTVTSHTGQRLSGWTEGIALSDIGRRDAERLAERLTDVSFDAIYSSPIDRTLQTARAIARPQGLTVRTRRDLGEVDYGAWTGRPLRSLMRTKLWQQVQHHPSAVRFPDGETLRETQGRAVAEVERIRQGHEGGTVCCVSHGDVIKLVLAHYAGIHIDLFQRLVVTPGSISILAWGSRGPRLVMLNHLVSDEFPGQAHE